MGLKVFSEFTFRKRIIPLDAHYYITRNVFLRQMAGLRNILIHAYSDVDLKRVRLIAKTNVPPLHEQVKSLLGRE